MDEVDLGPLLDRLSDNISDLELKLKPLLEQALSEKARQLPLLDRAKLYALIVYTVESLLFSYLRLHGVKASEHPVFVELTRVKQYFDKIKRIETGPEKPTTQLDKAAADRFIKHALTGNIAGGRPTDPSSGTESEATRKRKVDEVAASQAHPKNLREGGPREKKKHRAKRR